MGERRLSRERNALWDFASVPQEVGVALPTALACEARSPSRPRVVWLRVQDQWVEDPDDPTGPLPPQHPAPGDSTDFIPLRRWSPHPCLWSEVSGGPEREACIVHGALNPSISQTGPIPWEGPELIGRHHLTGLFPQVPLPAAVSSLVGPQSVRTKEDVAAETFQFSLELLGRVPAPAPGTLDVTVGAHSLPGCQCFRTGDTVSVVEVTEEKPNPCSSLAARPGLDTSATSSPRGPRR